MLSWGKSRRVAVRWYPWGDSTAPVSSRTLRLLRRRADLAARQPALPAQRPGAALQRHGLRRARGARVTIQVRTAGLWRTFLTPRSTARGRFAGRRLLTRSAGLSYCLRARILSQRGFAYSAGFSRSRLPCACAGLTPGHVARAGRVPGHHARRRRTRTDAATAARSFPPTPAGAAPAGRAEPHRGVGQRLRAGRDAAAVRRAAADRLAARALQADRRRASTRARARASSTSASSSPPFARP